MAVASGCRAVATARASGAALVLETAAATAPTRDVGSGASRAVASAGAMAVETGAASVWRMVQASAAAMVAV